MATYEIIFSPTGGTKNAADIFCGAISDSPILVDLIHPVRMAFAPEDLCVIAMPSFGGRIPSVCVDRMADLTGNGARAILLCVYGNRAIDDTLLEMKDVAKASGFVPVAAMEAVAEHSLIRTFGAGRPDGEDKAELTAFARQIADAIASGTVSEVQVPGNYPYRPFGGSLKPFGDDTCTNCGLCSRECPVGAIPADNGKGTDCTKCISCMRCLTVCPVQARKLDAAALEKIAPMLAKVCGGRKENRLYL